MESAANIDLPNLRLAASQGFLDDENDSSSDDEAFYEPTPTSYILPEVVKNFLRYFHKHFRERNVPVITQIYEHHFQQLTEKFFKASPWPPAVAVAELVDNDALFLILYKEMYYRHVYARLTPTAEQRVESWQTYMDLFDYLLAVEQAHRVRLDLPTVWLWDVIDQFVHQLTSFAQYRAATKHSAADIKFLRANENVWSLQRALHVLRALIDKSDIVAALSEKKSESRAKSEKSASSSSSSSSSSSFSAHPVYRQLGYFAMVGQLRLHVLLGDYYLALRSVEAIDMSVGGIYNRVTACHVSIFYYTAFAYLMTRRYGDALKRLATMLAHISRTIQYHTRSAFYERLLKFKEQMYAMLAISVALQPMRLDENVHAGLREQCGEKTAKLQRGDQHAFEELFTQCAPRFLSAQTPDYEQNEQNVHQRAQQKQLRLFLTEVIEQAALPTVRSFLKLYTTISVKKLAAFLDVDEQQCADLLLCYKHKTRALMSAQGERLRGAWQSSADVAFHVDANSMVHIEEQHTQRRYGDYFVRNIARVQDLINDVQNQK